MEGNDNDGGNGRSSSSTNSGLARKRKRGDDTATATQLQAGESSTASTPALLHPDAQSSSSTDLAGQEQSSQSHVHDGNVNAFTEVESNTSALVSNNVGPIGASDAVPEMEPAVQGDSDGFQTPEPISALTSLNMQARQGQGIRILQLLLFQAYAVQMEPFENPDPDNGLTDLIDAAIEVHLKPRKYRRPINVSEDEQCGICLDEIVDGEAIAGLDFCMHVFHHKCIKQWLLQRNSCPFCNGRALFINLHDPFTRDY